MSSGLNGFDMTLDEIASAIAEEQVQFKKELRAAVVRARKIGELLLKAKEQIPHGEFGDWVTSKAQMSHVWATNCMAIARGWDKVESHGVDITVRQAANVARGKPVKEFGGIADASVGRLLHKLEEKVAEIVLDHPEVADIVDAIHTWRERLERIGGLQKPRGVPQKYPESLVEKVRNARAHGYKMIDIHRELQAKGIDVPYHWIQSVCSGKLRKKAIA